MWLQSATPLQEGPGGVESGKAREVSIPRLRNSGGARNSLLLIVSTNLLARSDSRCLSGKLDSEGLVGAVVALSLRTYKFLSSPPGAAFFGVLPMATTAISGVCLLVVPS